MKSLFLFILLPLLSGRELTGLSTIYWRNDGFNNGRLGCVSVSKELLGHSMFDDTLPIVATRGKKKPFQCGDVVLITHLRTGLSTLAVKLDTGPFSCYLGKLRIVALHCPSGWMRKSYLDMTPIVAKRIGHRGHDRILVQGLKNILAQEVLQP